LESLKYPSADISRRLGVVCTEGYEIIKRTLGRMFQLSRGLDSRELRQLEIRMLLAHQFLFKDFRDSTFKLSELLRRLRAEECKGCVSCYGTTL
jgi:hypothetical protein